MLLRMDEYPYHQITESFAGVQGSDPQWNDGHYVCLADLDGRVGLTSNLRLYQNNDVLDGFVCVTHAGRQHNIRLTRRLRPDMDSFAVGPLRIDIVEPMRTLRFVLDDNEHEPTARVGGAHKRIPSHEIGCGLHVIPARQHRFQERIGSAFATADFLHVDKIRQALGNPVDPAFG